MSHKVRKPNSGFTIIEVLIVLAIVGLIMLIVFLAVPALQRNSRNTAIKSDVSNVLGGVVEFTSANNGRIPTNISGADGKVDYTGSSGTTPTSIRIQGATTVTRATGSVPQPGTNGNTNGPTNGTINVYIGKKCDDSSNSRSVAAVFSIETTSSSTILQCTDS